jgi:hypothetical protein
MWINSRFRIAAGWVATLSLCVALVFADPPSENTPPWAETLLTEVKLTPAKAQLDPNKWTGGGQYRLSTFQLLWDDWREIDPTARVSAKAFLTSDTFETLIATAAPMIDVKPLPSTAPASAKEPGMDPPADEVFTRAVIGLHAVLDKPLTAEQRKDLDTRLKAVPSAVARAAAVLLEAMPAALQETQPGPGKVWWEGETSGGVQTRKQSGTGLQIGRRNAATAARP